MTDKQTTQRDLLVKLHTQSEEILRRMEGIEKNVVPRREYEITINELREHHTSNQKDIKRIDAQIARLMWKLGGGLGSLQVITSIVFYILATNK